MKKGFMTFLIICLAILSIYLIMSCRRSNSSQKVQEMKYGFSRMENKIRYNDLELDSIDSGSFEIIDEYYCKDKDHVYFHKAYRESSDYFLTKKYSINKLIDAVPKSFMSLGYGYGKDNRSGWLGADKFDCTDPVSLQVLDIHFSKDNFHVYIYGHRIKLVDGSTFERINDYYAKDSKAYYYIFNDQVKIQLREIPCIYDKFELLNYNYSKDNKHVFYNGNELPYAQPESFAVLQSPYSKDSQHVFFRSTQIADADPLTFELFEENELSSGAFYYAKDKDNIFVNENIFKGADRTSFKILNEKYSIDKNNVFFDRKIVKQADPGSFKTYPHFVGEADAEDKHNKFGDGKLVK